MTTEATISTHSRNAWTDGANLAGLVGVDSLPARRPFTAADALPRHAWPASPIAAAALAQDLARWGALVVSGLGVDVKGAAVLGERLATPAHVHTGCSFSLRASATPTHLGETFAAISPHTDLAYRQHPPTLQVLHSIQPALTGGCSMLVDGLAVVAALNEMTVELLSTVPIEFVAISETVHFRSRRPLLELVGGELRSIAYNRLKLVPVGDSRLRAAIDCFERALADPALVQTLDLGVGEALVFDNRRVLHGRTPFDDPRRHLEGWFGNIDDVDSLARLSAIAAGE